MSVTFEHVDAEIDAPDAMAEGEAAQDQDVEKTGVYVQKKIEQQLRDCQRRKDRVFAD